MFVYRSDISDTGVHDCERGVTDGQHLHSSPPPHLLHSEYRRAVLARRYVLRLSPPNDAWKTKKEESQLIQIYVHTQITNALSPDILTTMIIDTVRITKRIHEYYINFN